MTPALHLEPAYRSGLEKRVADQLTGAGVKFAYESQKVPYTVPAKPSKYIPDFTIPNTNIVIEAKGRFGHRMTGSGAKERQKLILVRDQNPELDIRLVFQDAKKRINKGSPTTYAIWADANGFVWADKGTVPDVWLRELKPKRKPKG